MAEGWAKHLARNDLDIQSSGLEGSRVHPTAKVFLFSERTRVSNFYRGQKEDPPFEVTEAGSTTKGLWWPTDLCLYTSGQVHQINQRTQIDDGYRQHASRRRLQILRSRMFGEEVVGLGFLSSVLLHKTNLNPQNIIWENWPKIATLWLDFSWAAVGLGLGSSSV